MQLLSYFLRKYRFFLFFLLLESVAFYLIIQNHSFHKSKFVTSANSITGGFYQKTTDIKDYFSLEEENLELIQENLKLKQQVENLRKNLKPDSTLIPFFEKSEFIFKTSRIIKNSYNDNYNFLLINSGTNDSIKSEMAVVNGKGIIGVTEKSSKNYTRIQSILNLETKINAKLKNSDYYGSLTWNGIDYNIVQLIDVERQAPVTIGDTIITGSRSAIFPEGIPIGTVIKSSQSSTITSSIDIKLFNDMSNLRNVYIISNNHRDEITKLEAENE